MTKIQIRMNPPEVKCWIWIRIKTNADPQDHNTVQSISWDGYPLMQAVVQPLQEDPAEEGQWTDSSTQLLSLWPPRYPQQFSVLPSLQNNCTLKSKQGHFRF